jgi:hypothetical protein
MAGAGFVLPEDESELIAERIEAWKDHYPLSTPEDFWFLDQLALESVRIERCQDQERALLCRQRARAECRWDNEKQLEATRLSGKLAKKPAEIRMELQMTSQGCSLLIERWTSLRDLLKPGKPWEEAARSMALDMLGVLPEFREGPTRIDAQDGQDAIEVQKSISQHEIERLTGLKGDTLDGLDDLERDLTVKGLSAPDRDVQLMRRYEAACRRRFDAALRKLHLACQKDLALRMVSRQITTTPPPEPEPAPPPSPSPSIDPRGFALIDPMPPPPPNPFDEDADWDRNEATRVEEVLKALKILADEDARQIRERAQAVSVLSSAPASRPVLVEPAATARPDGNRHQRRALARQLKARRAGG